MSVDGNNPEYGAQLPVLVHPAADGHLFNLIGAFWHLLDVRSHLIEEVVYLERAKQTAADDHHDDLAEAANYPIRDTEAMLAAAKKLHEHLTAVLVALLGKDAFISGEFLTWYQTICDMAGGDSDASQ